MDDGSDEDAVSFSLFGTERGREGHEAHWPLWTAQTYSVGNNGSIEAKINYAGVVDWGRSYAFVSFPVNDSRQVLAGWTVRWRPSPCLCVLFDRDLRANVSFFGPFLFSTRTTLMWFWPSRWATRELSLSSGTSTLSESAAFSPLPICTRKLLGYALFFPCTRSGCSTAFLT
jgi:hypothetical protein